MRPKMSLAGQFLILQLFIVLLVVGAVAAVSLPQSDLDFRRQEGRRLLSIAETVAANDTVRTLLTDPRGTDAIAAIAETSRAFSGVSFIDLTDRRGQPVNDTDAGRAAEFDLTGALSGRASVDVAGAVTKYLVAYVPVLSTSGAVVGAVVAGRIYPTWLAQLSSSTSQLLTYLLIGGLLGVIGSLLLARRIKRQTLDLEPREITSLVEQREAMLHGIREAVIGTDTADRITIANDEAVRLLGLPPDAAGRPLSGLGLDEDLVDVLTGRVTAADQVVLGRDRILVLNRMPVLIRSRRTGWITTLRDRTELTSLQRELDVSRSATNTLRAQAHEFTNRLHIIAGLVQLEDYDGVIRFITTSSQAQENLTQEVTSRVTDPALAALLIAKTSLANEQGVTLTLSPTTAVGPVTEQISADLAVIVGNLVDNALDAVEPGGRVDIDLSADDEWVVICVRDSGPGVPPTLAEEVVRPGFTTKSAADGHSGLGLALIRRACVRRGGSLTIEGSMFRARVRRAEGVPS
jgi:sensor histidine kinase regulating citrate/malate metabolism